MLPNAPLADAANQRRRYAESFRDLAGWHMGFNQAPNFYHVRRDQLRTRIALPDTWRWTMATLFHHVLCVVLWLPGKQVRRITTGRIVACMTDESAIGYLAMHEDIAKAMRTNALFPCPKLPVTVVVARSRPLPTIVRAALIYLCPESLFRRWVHADSVLMSGDEPAWLTAHDSVTRMVLVGNRRGQTAAAFAQLGGAWIRGIMGLHRNSSFRCRSGGVHSAARSFCFPYSCNCSTNERPAKTLRAMFSDRR